MLLSAPECDTLFPEIPAGMKTRHEPNPKITNIDGILFFYTRKEAGDYAVSIGWPRMSSRKVTLPFGRVRFVVSDDHCNVLLAPSKELIDDPEDVRMTVEHMR